MSDVEKDPSPDRHLYAGFMNHLKERPVSTLVDQAHGIYVASRASLPERPARWRALRDAGWPIVSTWIDEAGEGETADLGELWERIHAEVRQSAGVVLHVEEGDFPLKGALIEVGMALGMGKRVGVYAPGVALENRSMRPLGSWAMHPLVALRPTLEGARDWVLASPPSSVQPEKDERRPLSDEMQKQARELFPAGSIDYGHRRGVFYDGWLSAEEAHGISPSPSMVGREGDGK